MFWSQVRTDYTHQKNANYNRSARHEKGTTGVRRNNWKVKMEVWLREIKRDYARQLISCHGGYICLRNSWKYMRLKVVVRRDDQCQAAQFVSRGSYFWVLV